MSIKRDVMARQESQIIRLTRYPGGMSRAQIAKSMQMSPSAIAPYIDRLLREGYLEEAENIVKGPGRPRTPLIPRKQAGCFIGAEISLRFIRILRVDFAQNIEIQTRYEVGPDCRKDEILAIFLKGLKESIRDLNSPLLGCGIGVNGAIDPKNGISLYWKEVPDWKDVPLKKMVEDTLNVPALLESNNHCLALSEFWYGEGKEHPTFLCVSARMTVGATLVVDGQLWNGHHGNSGLIGSWEVPSQILPQEAQLESERPFQENYGIPLLQIASTKGILSRIRTAIDSGHQSILNPSPRLLFDFLPIHDAYQEGDAVVQSQFQAAARALGWTVGELSKLFDVPVVIVSGLRLIGPLIIDEIQNFAYESLDPNLHARPTILASSLFEFASAQGAVGLLIHNWGPRLPQFSG